MSKARSTGDLVASDLITSDIDNNRIGIGSAQPTATLNVVGIVSATSFFGDGSNLSNIIPGLNELDATLFS